MPSDTDQSGDEIDRSWWPSGASEQLARECNCDYCTQLVDKLDSERAARGGDEPATDDGDMSLHAFAEGE